ncbi:MAG: purine-binding chemotaxis protein CheW [Acidobacteria bacterium]|nr:purine-binding chemotaxis protein CheW [Acidobacteriota bacterium]
MSTTPSLSAAATGSRQFSTFYVDGLYFGVEVLKVQELIRYQDMTRVPLAPGVIRGLINLRGQIVTAIDMRRRLDMHEPPADRLPMNVVVRTDDGAVSLLVDEIGDVVDVQQEQFEAAPETIRGRANDLVTGVYKMTGRLLLVLDVERAVSVERPGARAAA